MRTRGPTFDPDKICWFDTETGCKQDLKDVGAYRYAVDPTAHIKILTYAIGREPVKLHTAFAVGQPLTWPDFPAEFRAFADLARQDPRHKFAAHNAAFDRAMLNYAVDGAPELPPEMFIDTAFQATASGLPPDLATACFAAGAVEKMPEGKKLVAMFCGHKAWATPQSHPAEWALLCQYAVRDVEAMRSLFLRTMQLPPQEWVEYWSQERINERGLPVDVEFARNADKLSQIAKLRSGNELARLTDGRVTNVNGVRQIREYLLDVLPEEGVKLMTKREEEEDEETGEVTRPAKYSLTRARVEKLIPYCETVQLHDAKEVLELRLYGGSAAPAKYGKILRQEVGGFVYGQYVPGGAAMTGRASSRGIQIQNLVRKALPYEHDAIEAVLADIDYDSFVYLGDDTPVMRKLALLIRTVFVPSKPTNLFVGSDLAQIEARIGRWLPNTPEADTALQVMRDCDADSSLPDIYVRAASAISNLPVDEIDEDTRQRGKIAELALLFGGSVGALQSMASGYGLYIADDEAKETVQRWRGANQWCVRFWGKHNEEHSYGLWGAACRALENPGKEQTAGRIRYIYLKEYLNGSLLCRLPSGRHLTYRGIRFEMVDELDDDDNVIGRSRQLRFWKGRHRSKIWHGTLMENAVQAVAADVLRGILVRLEESGPGARLQSHDEVLIEVAEGDVDYATRELRRIMRQPFEWSDGLPLMSDEKTMSYYSKWKAPKAKKEAAVKKKKETQKAKKARCQKLIDGVPFGGSFNADQLAEFKEIIGVDVLAARHVRNPTYPTDERHVRVQYPDGSWDGISWNNCISGINPRTALHKVLRGEIDPDIADYRSAASVTTCPNPYGNARCNGSDYLQVDHADRPFDSIAAEFVALFGPIDVAKGPPGGEDIIRDRDLAAQWIEFHATHATYQILCRSCNASKGRR